MSIGHNGGSWLSDAVKSAGGWATKLGKGVGTVAAAVSHIPAAMFSTPGLKK